MFLFILIEKVLGKKNPVKNRLIVKKIMLPVMKNVNLQQGNKIHSKVENSRQLIKTSKIKASEPLKNNLNKKIVAKRSSAANNLGSVVPKSKKGPVLANIVKESLGVKKRQKEVALLSTPITKNLVSSNNKRQKQKNGSPIIYKSKRQQW
jgi:antitoxin component of MazEF toxin-antitoxin module